MSSEQNQTKKRIAYSSNWDPTTGSSSLKREIRTTWCQQTSESDDAEVEPVELLKNWPTSHDDEHANEAHVLKKWYVLLEMKKGKRKEKCMYVLLQCMCCRNVHASPTSFSSKCNNKQYVFPSLYSDSWSNWCLSIIFF